MIDLFRRVLGIDCAGSVMAVGYWAVAGQRAEVDAPEPFQHSRRLVAAVRDVLGRVGVRPAHLDLIAVSAGPGSYTGLRVGATAAKVIAWQAGLPLVGVDSLAVRAANVSAPLVIAGLPARRGEIYVRAYRGGDGDGPPEPAAPSLEGEAGRVLSKLSSLAYGLTYEEGTSTNGPARGSAPVLLGEGLREAAEQARAAFPAGRFASPDDDHPRGTTVAWLGRERAARSGTTDALRFVPRYVGPDVASE